MPSYSINGHTDWYSNKAGRWMDASTIQQYRAGIADTYTKIQPEPEPIPPRRIPLQNGVSTEALSIKTGEEVNFVFNLSDLSVVNFLLFQARSSGGGELKASLESPNGKKIEWTVPTDIQTYQFSPFYLNRGEQRLRLTAERDVTIYLSVVYGELDTSDCDYEVEPNDAIQDAMPIQLDKTYFANIYNPKNEHFGSGIAIGVSGEDLDLFSFNLGTASTVDIPLAVNGSMYYAVWKKGSESAPIKTGVAMPGRALNVIECGRLEAGTYYLETRGGSFAYESSWTKAYAFSVTVKSIEDPEPVPTPVKITNISLSATQYTYDGTAKKPGIIVKSNNRVLTEGVDYAVTWPSDITNVGKKEITVTGKGNYIGTLKANYEVIAAPEPDPTPVDPKPDNPTPVPDPVPNQPDNPGVTDPEPDTPTDSGQVMYRLYNPNSGEHFYTASTVERDAVIAAGWNDEGIGWTAPTSGIQVYRLYNSFAGEHHYTTSEAERDMLVSVGWTWEEGGWFSDINQAVPLYRAYNPNAFANNHHYTTDWGEFQMLLSVGWKDEGVGWHGVG